MNDENFSYKNINITEKGLYYIYLSSDIDTKTLDGAYITTSKGLRIMESVVYGTAFAGFGVPIWLTPDVYKIRKPSNIIRAYCIVRKYIKE